MSGSTAGGDPAPTAAATAEPVPTPAETVSGPVAYTEFLAKFLRELPHTESSSPKERLSQAAAAWRALPGEKKLYSSSSRRAKAASKSAVNAAENHSSGSATDAGDTPVTKHAVKPVTSLSDTLFLLTSGQARREALAAGHRLSGKLVIARTKENQQRLTKATQELRRQIQAGKITTVEGAYMQGINAILGLVSQQ